MDVQNENKLSIHTVLGTCIKCRYCKKRLERDGHFSMQQATFYRPLKEFVSKVLCAESVAFTLNKASYSKYQLKPDVIVYLYIPHSGGHILAKCLPPV